MRWQMTALSVPASCRRTCSRSSALKKSRMRVMDCAAVVVCSVTAGAVDTPLAWLSPTQDQTGSSIGCTPPGVGTAAGPSRATTSDRVAS